MAERAKQWGEAGYFEQMVAAGHHGEADAAEVEGTVELLLEKLRAGEISEHCFETVLRRLAEEKARDYFARTGRTGRWER